MKLSFKYLQQIRQTLEKAWDMDTAHETYSGAKGSSVGQCFVSTLVAFVLLEKFNPQIVHGAVEGADDDHFWLEINGEIIDFTADQFPGYPPVIFLPYHKVPSYRPEEYETSMEAFKESSGFRRFKLLLNRLNLDDARETWQRALT